jgi:hypothetical protein
MEASLNKCLPFIFALTSWISWHVNARASATDFGIISLNIAWYGLGGDINGSPAQEHRDADLSSLLAEAFETHEAGVFEEIVNVDRFVRGVVPPYVDCRSYDHPDQKHQHVVVCVKKPYHFESITSVSEFTWDDVAVGNTRPALAGKIFDRKGRAILNLIALHLKSSPDFSHVRKQ